MFVACSHTYWPFWLYSFTISTVLLSFTRRVMVFRISYDKTLHTTTLKDEIHPAFSLDSYKITIFKRRSSGKLHTQVFLSNSCIPRGSSKFLNHLNPCILQLMNGHNSEAWDYRTRIPLLCNPDTTNVCSHACEDFEMPFKHHRGN